jgi:hypothetical protein
VAGSATPNPYVISGASLHRELKLLVEAGLTLMQALRAATHVAGDIAASGGGAGGAYFDRDNAPGALKVSGMIVDGVIYLRGCETRAGPYPYCRQMRHNVYSVTKSLGAAVTLLRLVQQYGDQVFDLKRVGDLRGCPKHGHRDRR